MSLAFLKPVSFPERPLNARKSGRISISKMELDSQTDRSMVEAAKERTGAIQAEIKAEPRAEVVVEKHSHRVHEAEWDLLVLEIESGRHL